MHVRRERMRGYFNDSTYRAIEAENARAAMEQSIGRPPAVHDTQVSRVDRRDPVAMARAANAALKGAA